VRRAQRIPHTDQGKILGVDKGGSFSFRIL
jgi:hypothetical protein